MKVVPDLMASSVQAIHGCKWKSFQNLTLEGVLDEFY